MTSFIIKRLLSGLLLVIGLLIFTFFLVRTSPGNPSAMGFDPTKSPELMTRLEKSWGLNQPLHTQFIAWSAGLLHGDLGRSYSNKQPVTDILKKAIPNTLLLTIPVLILQILLGLLLGLIQITRYHSLTDKAISGITMTLYAVPVFWLALIFIMFFSQYLGWLPSSQMQSFGYENFRVTEKFMDRITHLILPVSTMTLASIGVTSRYIRTGLAGIMNQPYIMAARARGLSEKRVIFIHALRNTLVPVITITGQFFPILISSSIVIELLFSWPGMGRLIVLSSYARDYPVIIASTLVMSVFVIIGTLLADIASALVDPRIRLK